MKRERIAQMTSVFHAPVEQVWNVVTDNTDWSWRSDLCAIKEKPDGITFIEYPKKGSETVFKIVKKEPFRLYAFHMEHAMFTGEWTGEFSEAPSGGACVVFTERMQIRNPLIWLLSFVLMDLHGMQERYFHDLRVKLGEKSDGETRDI